jgi:hypothetical protein
MNKLLLITAASTLLRTVGCGPGPVCAYDNIKEMVDNGYNAVDDITSAGGEIVGVICYDGDDDTTYMRAVEARTEDETPRQAVFFIADTAGMNINATRYDGPDTLSEQITTDSLPLAWSESAAAQCLEYVEAKMLERSIFCP